MYFGTQTYQTGAHRSYDAEKEAVSDRLQFQKFSAAAQGPWAHRGFIGGIFACGQVTL